MKIKCSSLRFVFLGSILLFAAPAWSTPIEEIASPVSNPVNFEDPRIQSNIKPIYVHHEIDDKFVTGGGGVDIYALQLRYAVNDRLAIIATKDGYVHLQPNGVLNDDTGFANLAGGLKYAFFSNESSIATGGLRYEAASGEKEVLQGQGDGIFNPFLSAATAFDSVNLVAYTGFRFPVSDHDSSFYDASIHIDKRFGSISPLFEVNLFHVLRSGDRLPIADEGQDFFNIGSSESDGETMITGAAGARTEIAKNVSWGIAYEFPIANGSGTYITDWRLTTDLTFTF